MVAQLVPLLAAQRKDQIPPGARIPADVQEWICSFCGGVLMLARSSRNRIRAGTVVVGCFACVQAELRRRGHVALPVLVPEAIDELKRWREADRIREEQERG